MAVNQAILQALTPVVPVVRPVYYGGEEREYITFNCTELPTLHGDDTPHAIRYLVQVHWFLPAQKSPMAKKKQIRAALLGAGFTCPSVTDAGLENQSAAQYAADGIRHLVFECEYLDGDV